MSTGRASDAISAAVAVVQTRRSAAKSSKTRPAAFVGVGGS